MKKLLLALTLASLPVLAEEKKDDQPRNRVKLVAGAAKDTGAEVVGTSVIVREEYKFVYGVSYDRKLDSKVVVGGTVLSNGSLLGSVGFDF